MEGKDQKGPAALNNAMFVGSTADLAKMLSVEEDGTMTQEQIKKVSGRRER